MAPSSPLHPLTAPVPALCGREQEAARRVLEEAGLRHYWDAAAAFNPDEAPLVTL